MAEERRPAEGDPAPGFELPDQNGEAVRLSDLRGKRVVLYFYPRDGTPGCTAQACGVRDTFAEFGDAAVLGISPDTSESHARFAAKHGLPFTLLADTDHAIAEAYGVWVEKSMYGKRYMGVERSTFLIGPDGAVERVWRKVKPAEHAGLVTAALA